LVRGEDFPPFHGTISEYHGHVEWQHCGHDVVKVGYSDHFVLSFGEERLMGENERER